MRVSFGKGGWVGVDGLGLPGPLYVRFRLAPDDRLRVSELYLDGSESENELGQADLRDLPLSAIEAFVNAYREEVIGALEEPAPDLSTLATYFRTVVFGVGKNDHWAHLALASQDPGFMKHRHPYLHAAPKLRKEWDVVADDREFRLKGGPRDGLTDDFLRDVARAYMAAVARGERPNQSIHDQLGDGYSIKTVERWVYTARQRGIMPRGRRGKVG